MNFIHETLGSRVLFGAGRVAIVPDEVVRVGGRALVIADDVAERIAGDLLATLLSSAAGSISGVRQHVPIEDAEAARDLARRSDAACIVAVGGGSTIGLAKAIALTEHLPIVAVPTTYAGSEMTAVWGMTQAGVKTTGRDPVVAPRTVVYDPELTYMLPAATTAASGLNAIAHCVDGLWAPGRTPLTDAMAERGIAALVAGLPGAVAAGRDADAREQALIGAWLAGATFAVAGSSLHHKLCHMLGGRHDLPHAETHAVVLPWAVRLATTKVPGAAQTIARGLGVPPESDVADALARLARDLGAPATLCELGLSAERALAVADDVKLDGLATPFVVTRQEMRALMLGATG